MTIRKKVRWSASFVLLIGLMTWWPSLSQAVVPQISLYKLVDGLTLPVHITHAGDGSGRVFVAEKQGRIRVIKNGALQLTPFLDITERVSSDGERGLLSIAFPPLFVSKGYFYAYYTDLVGNIQISRFFLTANPDVADPDSEVKILTISHPGFSNHYGGLLAFGPDGFLYLGTGDGGGAGDPNNNAQNPAALLGKLLRIDVESGIVPYAIPQSNPFVANPAFRGEIWAYGLRNPFRFSFDRLTGDLYIADVGQNLFEEVDVQLAPNSGGQNYGWNIMEAFSCFNNTNPPASFSTPLSTCNEAGLTLPVFQYDHAQGCAIIGGFVYRGQVVKAMQGLYFYGDECTGRIWGLRRAGTAWQNALLFDTSLNITSFGEDQNGQLLVTSYATGEIFRIGITNMVTGDFNGDGRTDFAVLNAFGQVFYSTSPGVFVNVPGVLTQIVAGDFNSSGRSGLAGLAVDGSIWVSTDLTTWTQIPGTLSSLVSGNFNTFRSGDELAGLAADGSVWLSANLTTWAHIPGSLVQLMSGNFNGVSTDDLVGTALDGSLWQSTDLSTWTGLGQLP